MEKLRVLDLFSGIGGFSLGLERTGGFETVAFCEIEAFPRKVLAKHWPDVPCYDDVRTLTAERLAADGIAVDVICGGFPCQDISTAGKGAGLAGERSGLFYQIARLVGELAPRYVILENVAALLGRGLADVLGALASLGYDAEWHCIPASYLGAPHRRDRIWILAYPNSFGCVGIGSGQEGHFWTAQFGAWDGSEAMAHAALLQRDGGELHREHREGEVSELGTGSGAVNVADTDSTLQHNEHGGCINPTGSATGNAIKSGGSCDLADAERQRQQGQRQPILSFGATAGEDWQAAWPLASSLGDIWSLEPDVGGSPDGFPAFMDRYVGRGLTYAKSQRAIQTLRNVWSDHVSQTLRRTIGGFDRLQQAEVLFAFVREYEAGTDEARILVAGEEAPEGFLRSLRRVGEAASAPHRPGLHEQRVGEYPDAVQVLPRLLALNGAPNWAGSGWEDATPRVVNGVPDRAHRLKALGNAIVPQIAELIGRAILAALQDSRTARPSRACAAGEAFDPRVSPNSLQIVSHDAPITQVQP
jgi:DNA (cytosine-5)-methyltransferase 1